MDRLLNQDAIQKLKGQHPLCEGKNRDRILFRKSELAGEANSFTMRCDAQPSGPRSIYVDAGRILGITEGTEFTMQTPGSDDSASVTVLTVLAVEDLWCTVQPTPPLEEVPCLDDARAVFYTWRREPMKVVTSLPKLEHLAGERRQIDYAVTTSTEECDVSLERGTEGWVLERFDPLTSRYRRRQIFDFSFLSGEVLAAAARWNFHLYRFSGPESQSRVLRPITQLHRLKDTHTPNSLRPILLPEGDNLFKSSNKFEAAVSSYEIHDAVEEATLHDLAPYYGLTLYNHHIQDLYAYVFYFNPSNYSIQLWYAPEGNNVGPSLPKRRTDDTPGELTIGYGDGSNSAIKFTIPDGVETDTGFLKIFVSPLYVNMRSIVQNGIEALRDGGPSPLPIKSSWDSSVYVLTCKSPDTASQ
ncbi:uncharacterized protein B0H18DRAFT_466144 [Fomitopsis serialis]|uniref:uncharacterized protein n=1 Tax=Fomitopsis serialis TaxID=139415 RepID=UPI0020073D58|nr:uncharacterized protein B0H18DRAFT_466144 [Neoantrodia serialis]KAH9923560.1 hypothetical protein B0H18DRAFT_466144 [Neoantrodia serialis]